MLREKKKYLLERGKRISFIKAELLRLVAKSYIKNTKVSGKLRVVASSFLNFNLQKKEQTISLFRFYCIKNLSSKLVNKKYRLSRFAFNKIAHAGKIPGLVKKG